MLTSGLDPSKQARSTDGLVRISLSAFGGNDMLKGSNGAASLNAQTAGASLTLEHAFTPWLTAGVTLGGSSTGFGVSGLLSNGSQSAVEVGLYGVASNGPFYAKGMLSYGNYQTDETRQALGAAIGFDTAARASFSTNILGGRTEVGWQHTVGPMTVAPFAALEVDHLWQPGFTEMAIQPPASLGASGLALSYRSSGQTSVVSTLGGRVSGAIPLPGGHVLNTGLELGWEHDFTPDATLNAMFQAAPGTIFTVDGVRRSGDAVVTAVSASLPFTPAITLSGSLSGRFSGVETSYAAELDLRVRF
jgi:outer membrane autotransporter protein